MPLFISVSYLYFSIVIFFTVAHNRDRPFLLKILIEHTHEDHYFQRLTTASYEILEANTVEI